jgi:hypothetical protein
MAVYTPPTESLPIFDNGVFPASVNSALTPSTGQSYFLSYPVGQGQETITDLISTNINSLPSDTGTLNIAKSQTSGILQLGSTTRTGIIYLGNVIIQQLSGILSYSLNSFTGLTTLNLFSGSSSGFSSGFTTTNFLQGTLFKDVTTNILTIPTIATDTNIGQIINIGSGACTGAGINNSIMNIGSYSSTSGVNNALINIGNIGISYTRASTTQLTGKTQLRIREPTSNADTTQNLYGYLSYVSVTASSTTLSNEYNQSLFIVVSGSTAGQTTITLMPLLREQGISIRGIKTAGTGITITSNGSAVNMYALASSTATASITITITGTINLYCNGTNWFQY